MIGRVEVVEILGMAGTCAILLFAGFGVETMQGDVRPSWAAVVDVHAPSVPEAMALPEEIRLQSPRLERPLHPAPPALSIDRLAEPRHRTSACGCPRVIS